MYKVIYNNTVINYDIIKKDNKKNISICVKYPNIVTIVAPNSIDTKSIHDLVISKSKWIFNKLTSFQNIKKEESPILLINGSKIPYLGKDYDLVVFKDPNIKMCYLKFSEGKFISKVPSDLSIESQQSKLSNLLINFFIEQGTRDIKNRIYLYSNKLGINPKLIKVKEQKNTWGTCSSLGNIYINWRLLLAPIEIIDYVLIHELCHLKEMNHSKEFWTLVGSLVPDYKDKKNWLKLNGFNLNI